MRIVFFTFYFPPDLSAGSFRAEALVESLSKKIQDDDEIHIISSHPSRYNTYQAKVEDNEIYGNIIVHRIMIPKNKNGMFSQIRSFIIYAFSGYKICLKISPNFIFGTSSRLMTGLLSGISAYKLKCGYFIDVRDIFSETISDLFRSKSRILSGLSKLLFVSIEKKILNNANGVNVVSEAFPKYFQDNGIDTSNWSFFPNGIDQLFLNQDFNTKFKKNKIKTILYAGNIGEGQGLEKILPNLAKKIINNYHFLIIGDGSARPKLVRKIKNEKITNIEILPPVSRDKLISFYQEADILFLHLNDIPAFERVLPSKIFEYSVIGKPILAGLSGYSSQFMMENIPHSVIFKPGDLIGSIDAIEQIKKINVKREHVDFFIKKYSRNKIMNNMAEHIVSVI